MFIVPDTSRYVLYFGRLSEEKGVNVLAETATRLPNVKFILAGNGSMEVNGENIQMVGFVRGRLLQNLIKRSQFVVSPSVCTETFGLSNGEAIKLCIPVITTNLGAFPETVIDGVNGYLLKPGKVLVLKDTIERLWNDERTLERLKENCKTTELMSIEKYSIQVLEVYSGKK